jgi:hypothetical protein
MTNETEMIANIEKRYPNLNTGGFEGPCPDVDLFVGRAPPKSKLSLPPTIL